ncbi:MAG: hypothetical protein P8Y74_02505 [Desulfobacterales bacterium]|jgi:hypothetical protein
MNTKAKNPSRFETVLSFGILSVLALTAGVILIRQSDFNPAVLQLAADQVISGSPAALPASQTAAALVPLPQDVSVLTAPENFGPDTLSDKIDGKAELYLSAGFKRLQCQRFSDASSAETWMEIFIFDMASQKNAFAVYSSQQREDAAPSPALGRYAYRTANALYWVHGSYYVELIASEASEAILNRMQALAEAFNRATPVDTETIAETALFPKAGLDPQSITLIPADAFGFEKFDRVFVAEYHLNGSTLSAFVSARGSPEAAKDLAAAYRAFLLAFGGTALEDSGVRNAVIVGIMDEYEIIFTRDVFVAGVHAAEDKIRATALARSLDAAIEEAISGRQ